MPLEAGTTLLHYRLVGKLGAGGMGVVWKALDTALGREVAIKVLPDALAGDAERLSRFEREARLLASLSHPNIAVVHGLHDVPSTGSGQAPSTGSGQAVRFIAMELVPGDDLAERLARGPLPVGESLRIALKIAEALEAAHDSGVIHRDLKPANVKVGDDDRVKVLDFGLATAAPIAALEASVSPTLTSGGTRSGLIIGTPAYMSPEQARGKPLDRRVDIWAFGCTLYECLAGRRPFAGETVSDTLAQILGQEPDWDALPESTPPGVRRLLARCLHKDSRQRLRDIGDARIVLSEQLSGSTGTQDAPAAAADGPRPTRHSRSLVWGLALVLLGAIVGGAATRYGAGRTPPRAPRRVVRAEIPALEGTHLAIWDSTTIAISPDGSRLAFVLESPGTGWQLFVRELASDVTRLIPDTQGEPYGPFFSPDGKWIGYFDSKTQKLMRVPVDGGAPLVVCDAPASSRGGTWGKRGEIVFSPGYAAGLYRVSTEGGDAVPLTTLREGEKSHRNPQFLPDGRNVLFGIATPDITTFDDALIAVFDADTGTIKTLLEGGTYPRYLSSGHLAYARDAALHVIRFDSDRLEISGSPVRVLEDVVTSTNQSWALYDVSRDGTLVYVHGATDRRELAIVSVDFDGTTHESVLPPREYYRVRVSPDEQRLALSVESANADVWIYDLRRETLTRLTAGWDNEQPLWTPDGKRIVYSSNRLGTVDLYWRSADGSGEAELLYASEHDKVPVSMTPDGEGLAFMDYSPETDLDIWVLPTSSPDRARPLLASPFYESHPVFSPDGRWLAYTSNQSGKEEVYVIAYPDPSARWQISNSGGTHPIWSRDGRELYYASGDRMMAVGIDDGSEFDAGRPRELFEHPDLGLFTALPRVDLAPGGRGFLLFDRVMDTHPGSLRLVLNWFDELEAKLAAE